jgi:hypothetical protein
MSLTSETDWKELIIITDEEGRTFCISCGWGVEPPVAHIPDSKSWTRAVPAWLHERRDEVIQEVLKQKHVIQEESLSENEAS